MFDFLKSKKKAIQAEPEPATKEFSPNELLLSLKKKIDIFDASQEVSNLNEKIQTTVDYFLSILPEELEDSLKKTRSSVIYTVYNVPFKEETSYRIAILKASYPKFQEVLSEMGIEARLTDSAIFIDIKQLREVIVKFTDINAVAAVYIPMHSQGIYR